MYALLSPDQTSYEAPESSVPPSLNCGKANKPSCSSKKRQSEETTEARDIVPNSALSRVKNVLEEALETSDSVIKQQIVNRLLHSFYMIE